MARRPQKPDQDAIARSFRRKNIGWAIVYAAILGVLFIRNYGLGLTYFPPFQLGPITISTFGPLVALSILFGIHLAAYWCFRHGLDWDTFSQGMFRIIALGLIGSHLVHIIAYEPESLFNLKKLFYLRLGFSSFGGFLCGALVGLHFLKSRRLPLLAYTDAGVYGFTGAWMIARAGCFSVHDHPGIATDFFMGIYMYGIVRHDLGMYEMLWTIVIFLVVHFTTRQRIPFQGYVIGLVALLYSPVRFGLDFLRIGDATYAHLTPAQWGCIPFMGLGIWLLVRGWQQRAVTR